MKFISKAILKVVWGRGASPPNYIAIKLVPLLLGGTNNIPTNNRLVQRPSLRQPAGHTTLVITVSEICGCSLSVRRQRGLVGR